MQNIAGGSSVSVTLVPVMVGGFASAPRPKAAAQGPAPPILRVRAGLTLLFGQQHMTHLRYEAGQSLLAVGRPAGGSSLGAI